MLRVRSPYDRWLLFVLDGSLWMGALAAALGFRFGGDIPPSEVEFYWRFVPLAGAGMLASLLYAGAYDREVADRIRLGPVVLGWILGVSLAFAVLFLLKIPYSRLAFSTGAFSYLGALILVRKLGERLLVPRRPGEVPRVVCVGFPGGSLDAASGGEWPPVRFQYRERGGLDPAFECLAETDPDLILLNGSEFSAGEIRRIVDFGSRREIPVRILPDSGQAYLAETRLVPWRDRYVLRSRGHHRLRRQLALKTLFDYSVGSMLLLLSLPLQGVVALLIRFVDGAPVIFTQTRTGRSGRPFTVYKFRTMVPDAAEKGPALTEGPHDPRITPLGRFLRRWSLDELPQLFNVVRGEMSLVGPRPEIPSVTREYDPEQRRLFWLKPGLTGLSQVTGRQSLDLEEKLDTDQYYLSEYSLLLDLWILLRTGLEVLRGRGAA